MKVGTKILLYDGEIIMNSINLESEKIKSLKNSILEGNTVTINEFWKEIKENHTPIIEEI